MKGTQERGVILGSVDEIVVTLDDNAMNLQSMSASRFVGPFIDKVQKWEKSLSHISEVVDVRNSILYIVSHACLYVCTYVHVYMCTCNVCIIVCMYVRTMYISLQCICSFVSENLWVIHMYVCIEVFHSLITALQ